MIQNTFCHILRITVATERQLWADGVTCGEQLCQCSHPKMSPAKRRAAEIHLAESREHLQAGNPAYFADHLASREHWRLLRDFRTTAAFVDIETTGLGSYDQFTTIALFDGRQICHYIQGRNLEQFGYDIQQYRLLVTFNGKCFDVPFIERALGVRLPQAHVELRYVLKALGYSGGLKAVEKRLGMDRQELDGVDGFMAVLLWQEYRRRGDPAVLETLPAYNLHNVLNLETLMVFACNQKLQATPFHTEHAMAVDQLAGVLKHVLIRQRLGMAIIDRNLGHQTAFPRRDNAWHVSKFQVTARTRLRRLEARHF